MTKDTVFTLENFMEANQWLLQNTDYHIVEITTATDTVRTFKFELKYEITHPNEDEFIELKEWFNNTYAYKEQKYRRLIALNKSDDDGIDGQTKLIALYEEAETKRARIQELEELL